MHRNEFVCSIDEFPEINKINCRTKQRFVSVNLCRSIDLF